MQKKGIQFTPERSYNRRYVDHFYEENSKLISGRTLDIGAGENQYTRWNQITDEINEYFSTDIVREESIDVQGDATNLPFQSNVFDTVLLSEVIEHIPIKNLPALAEEISRVLKPGGFALMSTPFIFPHHGSFDKSRLTRESLNDLFKGRELETAVHTGGGYSEVILSVLHLPIRGLLGKIDPRLGWPFALLHYGLYYLSVLLHQVALNIAGRNPRADNWYLMTFTIVKKRNI